MALNEKELTELAGQYIKSEKDNSFCKEIETLLADKKFDELNDRFYKELDFGTGGIRGIIGGGFNRINPFIIKKTTQGLANYINKAVGNGNGSAVIAFDSRRCSSLFALETALVLCGNNIKTYLFTSLRPTPELSFAVRYLKCTAGIVITASHNPAVYNGYKVSWSDGGQVVTPHDKLIIEEVRKSSLEMIQSLPEKEALEKGLLKYIDKEVDQPYLDMVKECFFRPDLVKEKGKEIKIVYTPLHGAGRVLVETALSAAGIDVVTVPEQAEPDGNFPTVQFPNPEEASAMKLAIELAEKEKADLVIGTDPDSDRIGIAVPNKAGGATGESYLLINGNQLGSLLVYYISSTLKEQNKLPAKPAIIKTIVTTELQRLIGESFGIKVYDVLTGFKWIADMIASFDKTGEKYICGGEESYGFLVTDKVRDKDAVSAAAVVAEIALYCRSNGMTILDYLNSIYEKYGYFKESLVSGTFKGEKGLLVMKNLMTELREKPFKTLGGIAVKEIRDYNIGVTINNVPIPKSDVLQFILEDGSIVSVRPSGTEPKVKFYLSCREKPNKNLQEAKASVDTKAAQIEKELKDVIASQK